MDGGLFNSPRPTDRRAVNRPTGAQRQPEVSPAPAMSEPRHHAAPRKEQKSTKVRVITIVSLAVVAVLLGVGAWLFMQKNSVATAIDDSKYQAVFFTNGQVYFGKLSNLNGDYLTLKDIYYLQTQSTSEEDSKNPQEAATNTQSDVQLIKLGNEVHGPEDEMTISKDQVLFFENLKADGKVAKTISDSKK